METKERRVAEGEERGDAVLERVLLQREKHRRRSIFVRAGVMVAGGAVSVFAVPLLLAPELGLPLLLFGLRLLALEFDWAVSLYVRVENVTDQNPAHDFAGRVTRRTLIGRDAGFRPGYEKL